MNLLVLDYESYFDRRDYSLSRMTTESYIRDPRFEAHGCAIKIAKGNPAIWVPRSYLKAVLDRIDWQNTFAVAHHGQFDFAILNWHYGHLPAMIGDTLAMARLLLGSHHSVSLESVRKHFNIPSKSTPYNLFEGKHWDELSPAVQHMVGAGACDEVESIWTIFAEFAKTFPQEEYGVVDMVTRMFVDPVLRADTKMLGDLWQSEATRKRDALSELGLDETDLQSSDKFADLLREEGVEPETKQGKPNADGSEKLIYAFAKTDQFMRDLLEHDADRVRLLAETRLGVKSTILQTRAETLGWMASRGPLPVYLRYAGAGTLRVSGGDGANWLNFKRQSVIRKSILAPEGYVLAPIDASQIECRVLHYLAGGPDEPVVQDFRNGVDPYVGLSTKFYREQIYKPAKDDPRKEEMEAKRGMGKQGRLMCGYGAAGKQFKITAKNGLYGPPVDISLEDADKFVRLYREDNPSITHRVIGYWAQCEEMLKVLAGGATWEIGPLLLHMHKIVLPNGAMMNYDTLEWHRPGVDEECRDFERGGYWRMKTRQGWKKMWGSKLTQNCLAADVLVLTSNGWKAITDVRLEDRMWDGGSFVVHKGVVAQGLQNTIVFEGARMTPDHLVWTSNGWIRAAFAKGLHRASVRIPKNFARRRKHWKEALVGSAMRLWKTCRETRCRFQISSILRLQKERTDWQKEDDARLIESSRICSLGFNARPMLSAQSSGVQTLWRAWNFGLQKLASIREFLARHVADLRGWVNLGTKKEPSWIQQKQLCMVGSFCAGAQSSFKSQNRNTLGHAHNFGGGRQGELEGGHAGVSRASRMAPKRLVSEAGFYEPTYDIMDCGPHNQFVVLGDNGPFIVHNCCEAVSRVIVSQAMLRIWKQYGIRTLNWPYDELLLLLKRDGHEDKNMEFCMAEMRREVSWLPGLPLDCEGSLGERYSK